MLLFNRQGIVNSGLVGYWDAGIKGSYPGTGTNWMDLAGENDASLINGPLFNESTGGSIVFDGVNDRIERLASNVLSGSTSVDLWLRPDRTIHQLINYPFSSGNGTITGGVGFSIWAGGTFSSATTAAGSIGLYSGGAVTSSVSGTFGSSENNVWNHICVTYDPSTGANLYKNAAQLSLFSNNVVGAIPVSDRFFFGIRTDLNFPWDGRIAAVRFYNRVLSSQEIAQNFNVGRRRFGV